MSGLQQVIDHLRNSNIVGELWVNGSFLTEKINPADVDICLRIQAHLYENGSPQQQQAIDWLNGDLKQSHHCDSYVFMEYPQGHQSYWIGQYLYAYWMKQWGFSRQNAMKGIAVVLLPKA
jgi:hypothetical protein